ncbi:putative ankyrin repeat-containing domain-containing protein [Helianthus anomalus]
MSASTTTDLASTSELPNAVSQQAPSISNNQQPTPNSVPPPPLPVPPPLRTASGLKRPTLQLNLPCGDLLAEDYVDKCVPLYNASINGDWEVANRLLTERQELVRFSITENHETALHIAASAQNTKFVEELVNIMDTEDLVLQNQSGNTALCLAALAGNKRLCEILVNRNTGLLTIPGSKGMMPLYMADLFGNHDTVKYLYDNSQKMTGDNWTSQNQGWVLLKCVEADLFGKYICWWLFLIILF